MITHSNSSSDSEGLGEVNEFMSECGKAHIHTQNGFIFVAGIQDHTLITC